MIPRGLIAQLRKTTRQYLTETATVERESELRGEYGERVHEWVQVASGVQCRVITTSRGDLQTLANQEVMIDQYKIILASGTEVGVDYRIIVGGHAYRVTSVMDDRTDELDINVIAYRER